MEKNVYGCFDSAPLSFDAEIKLMKLLGASEEVINELLEMKKEAGE